MARHADKTPKDRPAGRSYRAAITGRFVTSDPATRRVTEDGIARLRARGASEEFLRAARGTA
jgi:hypothetical protein